MEQSHFDIKAFTEQVRHLAYSLKEQRRINQELRQTLEQGRAEQKALKEEVNRLKADYDAMKAAQIISVTDDDIEMSKKRIDKMLRTVNDCISLMKAAEV